VRASRRLTNVYVQPSPLGRECSYRVVATARRSHRAHCRFRLNAIATRQLARLLLPMRCENHRSHESVDFAQGALVLPAFVASGKLASLTLGGV
jgi:hypothetical protein